jgi:putative ABC transport system substrate-binding protein
MSGDFTDGVTDPVRRPMEMVVESKARLDAIASPSEIPAAKLTKEEQTAAQVAETVLAADPATGPVDVVYNLPSRAASCPLPVTIQFTLLPEMPVVFTAVSADPIKLGLAESYTHPGGMVTGNVMNAVGGEQAVVQKRIAFLREIVPNLARVGLIASDPAATVMEEAPGLQNAAAQYGFAFTHYSLGTLADPERDLERAFVAARRDDVSAFYISGEPFMSANISLVMRFVEASAKPAVGAYPIWGRAGLLLSYATDANDSVRRAGVYAGRILKGEKPGDLPIEQASKFVLVINQKTARTLGLAVPSTLLAIADEVIE